MPRAKRKPSYKVTKESTGKTLVRCETCKVTLAWTADPAEIVPAIDAHHAELHPEEWRQSYEGKVQDLAVETQRTMRLAYELRACRQHFQDVIDNDPRVRRPEQWITWINATLDVCGIDREGPNYITVPPGDLLPGWSLAIEGDD